jgi:hypothetical protein
MSIEIRQSFLVYQNHHPTLLEIEGIYVNDRRAMYTSAVLLIQ